MTVTEDVAGSLSSRLMPSSTVLSADFDLARETMLGFQQSARLAYCRMELAKLIEDCPSDDEQSIVVWLDDQHIKVSFETLKELSATVGEMTRCLNQIINEIPALKGRLVAYEWRYGTPSDIWIRTT